MRRATSASSWSVLTVASAGPPRAAPGDPRQVARTVTRAMAGNEAHAARASACSAALCARGRLFSSAGDRSTGLVGPTLYPDPKPQH